MESVSRLIKGMLKPVIDAILALVLYGFLAGSGTILSALPPTSSVAVGFPFNIWVFLTFFMVIAFCDDVANQFYTDYKGTSVEPFNWKVQIAGIIVGLILFGSVFEMVYLMDGGSWFEVIVSWFLSLLILTGTTLFRVRLIRRHQ
jgi:hypothetical protein